MIIACFRLPVDPLIDDRSLSPGQRAYLREFLTPRQVGGRVVWPIEELGGGL